MARFIHQSKPNLYRLCMKIHNTTPISMVTVMRMERAAELLSFTTCTFSMIIDEIGYETPFSFSRAFKRYAGISPKESREWQTQARTTQYPTVPACRARRNTGLQMVPGA
ncbi:MAG: helix-turn-helix transcriptional regulator [Kiritimatiellales bacterium]